MVYTGKPSKACARCRERRLKCDLTKPQCRKCQTAGVQCIGYRNEQDLLFRNVTHQVIDKLHKASERSPPTVSRAAIVRTSRNLVPVEVADCGVLAVALTFLFRTYLRGSSFEWVEDLYIDSSEDSLFVSVVQATALAAYSFESHRVKLLARARSTYNRALLQLRDAITAPGPAQDTTLASILLMSRFETLLNDGDENTVTETWKSHIYGAYSIVKSRTDEENFLKPLSYALSEQTVHNFNLYCLRKGERRPPSLLQHTRALAEMRDHSKSTSENVIRLKLHSLSDALIQCLGFLHCPSHSSPEMQRAVLEMDDRIADFVKELSKYSNFEVRSIDELRSDDEERKLEFEPHSSYYHVYTSSHSARLWNGVRMLRLTIHAHLVTNLEKMSKQQCTTWQDGQAEEVDAVIQKTKKLTSEICSEICASSPQFLRFGSPECTHAAVSHLAWPLFLAAQADKTGCARFVRDALLWIGSEFNIKSAAMAAAGLSADHFDDDCLLACYFF